MEVKRKVQDDELYHYGVLGMKWGVRRYQNYDGSYTQRGLKRFNSSLEKYESAKSKNKEVKESYKNQNATKSDVKSSKQELKAAKRELNTSYKRLKTDKKADKGKEAYRSGKTITGNYGTAQKLASASGLILVGSRALNKQATTVDQVKLSYAGAAIGVGLAAVGAIHGVYTKNQNNNLRAYYAHG